MKSRFCLVLLFALWSATAAAVTPATALGLLVDSASAQAAHDGLRVLGATPGSVADQLGLRPGDLIVDVNGTALANLGADANGRALAAATFNAALAELPQASPLRLRILRDGVTLALNSPSRTAASTAPTDVAEAAPATPATGGCGRISTFDVAPRNQHLYRAKILLLDGTTPGPTGTPSFRVSAGTHKLLVAENIPTEQMGVGSIASLRSRRDTSKTLIVTVQPDTTSLLAARLNTDKASEFAHGAYWDPVIWRVIAEKCP
ncbi:MAG: PDZ domain-containing protein [Proteobacteria bacterium]|nr:PDZ domain-containing protein [Pseudomonadota bacterium]